MKINNFLGAFYRNYFVDEVLLIRLIPAGSASWSNAAGNRPDFSDRSSRPWSAVHQKPPLLNLWDLHEPNSYDV